MEKIRNILDRFGYFIFPTRTVRGASGCIHQIDFVCGKAGGILVISALEEIDTEAETIEIVKLRLKGYITAPDTALLMNHAFASSNVRSLCNYYGFLLIEKILEESIYDQID